MLKRRIAMLIILALMILLFPVSVSASPDEGNPFAAQDRARQNALASISQPAGSNRLMGLERGADQGDSKLLSAT